MPQGGQGEGDLGAEQAQDDVADVGRGHGGAQLHRLAGEGALEKATRVTRDLSKAEGNSRRRSLRSGEGQGTDPRVPGRAAARARNSRARSSASWGPPGVGKTSWASSIARATNRKFVRMSLGGVRDEAEIRGHRRTYIGSMPGKIVQNMGKVKVTQTRCFCSTKSTRCRWTSAATRHRLCWRCSTRNRTHTFNDHYLEVDFDLSEVMFVCHGQHA